MKYLLLTFSILTLFSCKGNNQTEIIQGNLYVKLINVHSFYGLSDEKLEEFEQKLTEKNSDSDEKLTTYFKLLIKHNLFRKPHFKLKTNDGKIANIYTSKSEYLKLQKELVNFDRDIEKISIKFEGFKIPNHIIDPDGIFNQQIYKANKIISVRKMKGKTDWKK